MTFDEILLHVVEVLQRQGRVSYRALKRRFALDDEYLEDLKAELIKAQRMAVDEDGDVLVWTGGAVQTPAPSAEAALTPLSYIPPHLVEMILTSRSALEGERKQVTVLFADLKGSMELLADRDPEEARQLLDNDLHMDYTAVGQTTHLAARMEQLALALATAGGDVILGAIAHRYLGQAYQAQGDYGRAINCFRQTMASFEGAQRREGFGRIFLPAVTSRHWLAVCHAKLGTFAEGRALGDEGLRIAEAEAHPGSLMLASRGIGQLCLRQGDLPRALPLLERAMGICQDADLTGFFPMIAALLVAVYARAGRLTDALPLLTPAVEQTKTMEVTRQRGSQNRVGRHPGGVDVLARDPVP